MQADHAVPAALVAGRQVFDEAGRLDALLVGNGGVGAQHVGQACRGLGVVVFVGAGQGDDQAAAHVVRDAVHVVDLRGQQQLADVAEHRVGHEDLAVVVGLAVDAGRHAAGKEALGDGDELDHLLAQVALLAGVEAVGLAHQRAGADQQVAEAGAGRDATVAVVRGVAVGQVARVLPFAGVEHALPRHEHAVEHAHAGALAVLAAEEGVAVLQLFAGSAGRPRDDGEPGRIERNGAADGEVGVFLAHVAAGHDQQFVHVRRAGHDGLGARNDDAARVALDHVQVAVDVRLLVRPAAAVALGVGHGDAQGQVLVLDAVQVVVKARGVLGAAARVVDARRHLGDGVERVVRQVALGAAGFLADQPHGLELVEQVARTRVDVREPVHALAAGVLHGGHERRVLGLERVVVGEGDGVDAGLEGGLVGHAGDAAAVDEHGGRVAAQRFTVVGAGHEEGVGRRGIHACCLQRLVGVLGPLAW
ncbi:hypothetical protein D9M72_386440 [compost metagenome]